MPFPYAYFITWTCYGTRVHGDARWSVDRQHNTPGEYPSPISARLERSDREQMKHAAVILTPPQRDVVAETIRAHAAIRGWEVLALNVRTTHVHVVVRAEVEPETVMGQFKAWASRRLRERGLIATERVWTRHGSTRYLWNPSDVPPAVEYVVNWQDIPSMPSRDVAG